MTEWCETVKKSPGEEEGPSVLSHAVPGDSEDGTFNSPVEGDSLTLSNPSECRGCDWPEVLNVMILINKHTFLDILVLRLTF